MSDQLLIVLRVGLLVLVYLVFLRVVRAVWVELRAVPVGSGSLTPAPATPRPADVAATPAGSAGGPRLVARAPQQLAGASFALDAETTIGRAGGCRIPLDDHHVSKLHARVFLRDDAWYVEDLDSTNGTRLNGETLSGAEPLHRGDRIELGETVLEVT